MILTILTPTYNRKELLRRSYQSLCKQNDKNFQWLVIDDGSLDGTNEFLENVKRIDNGFVFDFYIKKNGGKHTALNYSHPYIKGDFVLILDSDDFLLPNATEIIIKYIKKYNSCKNVGCISFRKGYSEIELIGKSERKKEFISNYIDYRINKNIGGDQCEVLRTELLKKYPFPVYKGEKFLGEDYLWCHIGYKFDTVYINKILYICQYLSDGLTKSGKKMQIKNPWGGMVHGKLYLSPKFKMKYRIKGMMLYICYALFANVTMKNAIHKIKYKPLFIFCLPLGIILYFFWKWKYT